jgi:hypothetical protein
LDVMPGIRISKLHQPIGPNASRRVVKPRWAVGAPTIKVIIWAQRVAATARKVGTQTTLILDGLEPKTFAGQISRFAGKKLTIVSRHEKGDTDDAFFCDEAEHLG